MKVDFKEAENDIIKNRRASNEVKVHTVHLMDTPKQKQYSSHSRLMLTPLEVDSNGIVPGRKTQTLCLKLLVDQGLLLSKSKLHCYLNSLWISSLKRVQLEPLEQGTPEGWRVTTCW